MSGLLHLDGFGVRYGATPAVEDISLDVAPGSVHALLGANGSGKSSLLKGVMGLAPATGTLALDGQDIARLPPRRRARLGIGYVPEGRRLFPGLTVAETLALACFDGAAARSDRQAQVFKLFPALAQNRQRRAWQLSGGQQQMLAIGRALMAGPRLILMDEPSFGLAPALLESLLDRLAEIAVGGTAILIAEQNAAVLDIAGDALVLRNGESVAQGPARELRGSDVLAKAYVGGAS